MRLLPFRALRYDSAVAGPPEETSAPPYDAFDPLQYLQHRTANPYTVLELQAGEADGGPGGFQAARATLARWRRTGVLVEDAQPALYLYEEHELRRGVPTVQRGIVGAVDLTEIERGRLLLHEHVDDARTALRAERMRQVPVDLTPVVALHMAPGVPDLGATTAGRPPVAAFTDEANVDHRLWRIDEPALVSSITAAHADVTAVLADGHHRVAAARQLAAEAGARWGRVTVWLVDARAHGPELRAVHRLVPGTPPTGPDGTPRIPGFRALAWRDGVVELERAIGEMPGVAFGVVTPDGRWVLRADDPRRLRTSAAPDQPSLQQLDAQVAATHVLPLIAPETAARAVFDAGEAADEVARSSAATLLLLAPPTAQQVLDVAASGLRMPAKTTWFRPKPRAGLVMRALDAQA
ncbi:DUF1015 family protein [Euzebya sp.]|uniref:DUF1015 family protein n=1 Tax=Euzebya sp. TaxID=1971409 RepID=UPI003518F884